jgi:hypothetical protein
MRNYKFILLIILKTILHSSEIQVVVDFSYNYVYQTSA